MAFNSPITTDFIRVGGGYRYNAKADLILTATEFEDGLVTGRFAKLDTGSIDNFDGSATPEVAGIVLRDVTLPIEDGATVSGDLYQQVEYARKGLFSVEVKDGEDPALFGQVYVSNAGDADDGKATATNTDEEAVGWEFIEEVKPGVWLVSK